MVTCCELCGCDNTKEKGQESAASQETKAPSASKDVGRCDGSVDLVEGQHSLVTA